jgi:hypothetical protein
MALLCNHVIPIGYDDNKNDIEQILGSWNSNPNECLLIKDEDVTINLYNNPNSTIAKYNDVVNGIRVRPGFKLTAYTDPDRKGISAVYEGGQDGLNKYIDTAFFPFDGKIGDKISSVFLEYPKKEPPGTTTPGTTTPGTTTPGTTTPGTTTPGTTTPGRTTPGTTTPGTTTPGTTTPGTTTPGTQIPNTNTNYFTLIIGIIAIIVIIALLYRYYY